MYCPAHPTFGRRATILETQNHMFCRSRILGFLDFTRFIKGLVQTQLRLCIFGIMCSLVGGRALELRFFAIRFRCLSGFGFFHDCSFLFLIHFGSFRCKLLAVGSLECRDPTLIRSVVVNPRNPQSPKQCDQSLDRSVFSKTPQTQIWFSWMGKVGALTLVELCSSVATFLFAARKGATSGGMCGVAKSHQAPCTFTMCSSPRREFFGASLKICHLHRIW